jgi:putative PIN family toxin of toxin-antitoxin system
MRPLRVVVDCNVFISILIGGSMKPLRAYLFSNDVELVVSEELLAEIVDVGERSRLRRYFDTEKLHALIALLREVGDLVEGPNKPPKRSSDPDDDYLLGVSEAGKADILLTGDEDLLILVKHKRTRIMNVGTFLKEFVS